MHRPKRVSSLSLPVNRENRSDASATSAQAMTRSISAVAPFGCDSQRGCQTVCFHQLIDVVDVNGTLFMLDALGERMEQVGLSKELLSVRKSPPFLI